VLELGSVSCLSRVSVTIGRQAGSTDALLVTSTVSSAVQGRTRLVACLREHVEHDATRDVSMTYRHDVTLRTVSSPGRFLGTCRLITITQQSRRRPWIGGRSAVVVVS